MRLSLSTIALCLGLCSGAAFAQDCGELTHAGGGPWDYNDPEAKAKMLWRVEQAHFDANVRRLKGAEYRNKADHTVPGDIDYTLRAFPNHPEALDAMGRYYLLHPETGRVSEYTPQCWFDRAIRWRPNDGMVRLVYGIFLYRMGHPKEALEQYERAVALAPGSAEAHYNLGLLEVELGDLDSAVVHAARAYELGFPLPGLRRKLAAAGRDLDVEGADPTAAQ
jgi:Tfp pilus assembly protein PilF